MNINDLKFDDKGLIPAIVQDFHTKEVLMLAYMNKESLQISIDEKCTCFYSRSRKELWRKGKTSGNVQHITAIYADCDRDSLLIKVIKDGPACHTGAQSCFFENFYTDTDFQEFSLNTLYELLKDRDAKRPEGSYTTYLFEKGKEKILKKVGEEGTEVVIAAMKDDNKEVVFEISDLCYHILVLMVSMGITMEELKQEMAKRHIVDNKVKQETMQ